jgi:predicted glycosyltransferase
MSRVLFRAHNRRGLGHLMRGLNIARAIRGIAPQTEIMFSTRNESSRALCAPEFQYDVQPEQADSAHWCALVESFAPDAIIYDTMLPAADDRYLGESGARSVYVMRKCKPDRQEAIFASPFLQQVDRILVPHTPDEFGYQIPEPIASKSVFVGPIVRPLSREIQQDLVQRYRLKHASMVIVSTMGGGGFADDAGSFLEVILATHAQIAQAIPGVAHIAVLGPYFGRPLPDLPGLIAVAQEPELGNLFALANLVIAEGGYNTVNEIRLAGVPAVFLPGDRSYDDQEERVRMLEQQGMALVVTDRDPPQIARAIAALCERTEQLLAMRLRLRAEQIATGNCSAARQIVELIEG